MKVLKKQITIAAVATAMTLGLTGCGSSASLSYQDSAPMVNEIQGSDVKYEAVADNYNNAGEFGMLESAGMAESAGAGEMQSDSVSESTGDSSGSEQIMDTTRKLIKNVNMNVETKEFDTLLATVKSKTNELGGYIESMDLNNGSAYSYYRSTRNASLTIRIPQKDLDEFTNAVADIGNVTSRSDSVEDITLTYVDTASKKDALVIEQERLLELLDKAESVEDILTIESRMSEVRYQLESIESRLRTYDNQVDYSTVYLFIDEVEELTPVEEKTAFERMAEGFVHSIKSIGNGFVEFAIWIVIHLPYIVVWVVVIAIIIAGIKAMVRRHRKKKEAKRQKAMANANMYNPNMYNPNIQNVPDMQTVQTTNNMTDNK